LGLGVAEREGKGATESEHPVCLGLKVWSVCARWRSGLGAVSGGAGVQRDERRAGAHTHAHARARTHTRIHTHARTHAHTHTHTYTHTHAYAHRSATPGPPSCPSHVPPDAPLAQIPWFPFSYTVLALRDEERTEG
jgi:hypothetical protein